MSKRYGLIVESKYEGPLIWESKPLTSLEASKKMRDLVASSNIIRVAVFEMKYETGNETLIPEVYE
jgi:hypothetical protein